MNIEKIKSEFERLSQIITAWSDNEPIAAIERDLALDKLLKIYDMVRFADQKAENTTTPTPIAEQKPAPIPEIEQSNEEQDNEEQNDVEVEFIFAEEQDVFEVEEAENSAETKIAEPQEQATKEQSIGEILAATVAASIVAEQPQQSEEPEKAEPKPATSSPKAEQEAAPIVEEVATPKAEQEEAAPKIEQEDAAPTVEQEVATPKVEPKAKRPMSSLFGVEEPQRKPRTKHQRMMSIYNDSESRPEKVVDISKIFDMDSNEPASANTQDSTTPAPSVVKEPSPTHEIYDKRADVIANNSANDVEPKTTLGDIMTQNTQTLADTIAAPTALGEEISHKGIKSLRNGIGLNDKFLMIRDLFDGDADAYDETIDALDGFDDFDDCIIYIAENFAWNADSEGAKFIMQLLERKLS